MQGMTPQCLLLYGEIHAREFKQTQLTEVTRYCHGVSSTLTDEIPSVPHIYPTFMSFPLSLPLTYYAIVVARLCPPRSCLIRNTNLGAEQ